MRDTARMWFCVPTAVWLITGLTTACAQPSLEFVRLMNLGKAHLENRSSKAAIEVLTQAVALRPESAPARRNLARAYLLARKPKAARSALQKAVGLARDSAATNYLLGLTFLRTNEFDEALRRFEEAVRLDPDAATLRFQLAKAYQVTDHHEQAVRQLRETVRLDPLHASAHFKLAGYARKAEDREEFQRRNREFMRLRKLFGDETRTADMLERCAYTWPEPAKRERPREPGKRAAAIEVRFVDVSDAVFPVEADGTATAAAVLDVDRAGRCTLFIADSGGRLALLQMSPAGTFERTALDVKLPPGPAATTCLVGNFHDDVPKGVRYDPKVHALNDVLLLTPTGLFLLKRTGPAGFRDVTEAAGLAGVIAHRAQWVDYEHDGDVDLLIARATGVELWQNNGDGRFENVTAQVGIADTKLTTDVAAADLDANVAVDLLVARGAEPTLEFVNRRAGRFAPLPEPPGPLPAAKRVLVNDLNNDGFPDTVLIADREAIVVLSRAATRQRIDLADIDVSAATLIDYDNDGLLDFCAVGTKQDSGNEGMVRLYRNVADTGVRAGADGWVDAGDSTGLASAALPAVRDLVAADVDADGDTDLLLLIADGRMRLLRNEGGHVNGQLKVRLVPTKTNPSGLGVHLELRRAGFRVTRCVTRVPIEIGLGGRKKLDSVRTVWTTGVVENQIDVASSLAPLVFPEKNIATGSCPFFYAWDGAGFRFVTDLLGNAPIGLPLSREVMLPADPDEIVLIGGEADFPPEGGTHTVKVTSEFCEVLYLDAASVIAVDHPPDVEVHPTDKLMPAPFPVSQLWAMDALTTTLHAVGDDGIDRTEALRAIDGVFTRPGPPLPPPFRGMCHPLSLTLDFGPLEAQRPLVLALTGWLSYGQASTNIALSQSRAHTIILPKLEAQTASGWQAVDVTVGMPAGKTKTILCDLNGRLPAGTRRLRLTTTFEIRWDRIALLERRALPRARMHALPPVGADLAWRGFSEIRSRAPGHPTTPDHDVVFDRPPWRTALEGWCTRYGDVLELTEHRDDRLVILNAGDALTLRFDAAALPPVPDDHLRTFFFSSIGWEKDCDPNVTGGDAVTPLPVADAPPDTTAGEDQTDWRLRYNTRWVPRDQFTHDRDGAEAR